MFTYSNLLDEVNKFNGVGVETGSIGDSSLGQRTPYIFIGKKGGATLIAQGAIHGREHITALLLVDMAKHLFKRQDLLLNGGIYFVPMSNVDGVRIAQEGLEWIADKKLRQRLIEINGGTDFSLWKSNARAVDVNVNFDARWGKGKQNLFYPSSANYVGKAPNSEVETQNLINFTMAISPNATISYHTKGEQIYWRFNQQKKNLWRDYRLAKAMSICTGYELVDGVGSVGGYKDWCVEKLGISAFTIEVGRDIFPQPYPYAEFEDLLRINKDLPRKVINTIAKDLVKSDKKEPLGTLEDCKKDKTASEKVDE